MKTLFRIGLALGLLAFCICIVRAGVADDASKPPNIDRFAEVVLRVEGMT